MEEDIKILEEFYTKGYSMLYIKYGDRIKTNSRIQRAIENLIKGYRELERTVKIKNGDIEYLQNKINKHFISDTKIQKKIEELENLKVQLPVEHMRTAQIKILKELLEGEE